MYFEPFQPLGLVNTADTPSGGAYAPQTQVSLFWPGNFPPFQPISGAQPGSIREKSAGF
jgi:hypothetical protein